jgi:hypothetical protein
VGKAEVPPESDDTDGNEFSLWRDGKPVGKVLTLDGNIETSGAKLAPAPGLHALFESFLD